MGAEAWVGKADAVPGPATGADDDGSAGGEVTATGTDRLGGAVAPCPAVTARVMAALAVNATTTATTATTVNLDRRRTVRAGSSLAGARDSARAPSAGAFAAA